LESWGLGKLYILFLREESSYNDGNLLQKRKILLTFLAGGGCEPAHW
jgi:hypothetical protein